MLIARLKSHVNIGNLIFAVSLVFVVWLVWYFYTGLGGSLQLAARLIPVALVLQILFMYQQGYLYKRLPPAVNHAIVVLYVAIAAYAFWYFGEYERIAIYSQGTYTQHDFIVGLLVFLLVMELTRLAHPVLFWVNVVMVVYTLYGYVFPRLARLLLAPGDDLLSRGHVLHGGVHRHLRHLRPARAHADRRLPAAGRRRQRLQRAARDDQRRAAVLPVPADAANRGGGIERDRADQRQRLGQRRRGWHHHDPLMVRYGAPPTFAAAVETSASIGGLIDPPMMGAAAFLMAEFLGVPYWDVVLRGFGFSFIYYISIGVAIYLLSVRLLRPARSTSRRCRSTRR